MIDITPEQLATVQWILAEHVPDCEVRAFGSRVTWEAKDYSDLDLAVVCEDDDLADKLARLREAFEESDLPFRVDVIDWNGVSEEFREVIDRRFEVVVGSTTKGHNASNSWTETSLGDVIDIKHGFAFKGDHIHDEPLGDVLLTPGNFKIGGGFNSRKLKYYDGPVPSDFVLQQGDLVVSMTDLSRRTDTLGYPALIPAPFGERRFLHNQRLGRVVLQSPDRVTREFVYCLMRSAAYRNEILASMTGTTVKHTSPNRIKRYAFARPPISEQRRIAHILGTLDDKIELNRQMNETLEAMARALFKSWLIDFDPVRAKAEGCDTGPPKHIADLFPDRIEASELGEIPAEWNHGAFGEIAECPRRSIRPDTIEPDTAYVGLEHLQRRSIELSKWGTAGSLKSAKIEFKRGEILFGKLRPYFHKVAVAPIGGVCSTDILVITPHSPEWFGFCLFHASSDELVAHADATSTGTKMPRTNWRDIAAFPIMIPPVDVATAFNVAVHPLVARLIANIHESQSLASIRAALLPKLISGELCVDPKRLEAAISDD